MQFWNQEKKIYIAYFYNHLEKRDGNPTRSRWIETKNRSVAADISVFELFLYFIEKLLLLNSLNVQGHIPIIPIMGHDSRMWKIPTL